MNTITRDELAVSKLTDRQIAQACGMDPKRARRRPNDGLVVI
jgi:hypothetical protein